MLLPVIHEWHNASVDVAEFHSYNGKKTKRGVQDICVKTVEHEKVCFEPADKTGRTMQCILTRAPYHSRDSIALLMEFTHSPSALQIVSKNLASIAQSNYYYNDIKLCSITIKDNYILITRSF